MEQTADRAEYNPEQHAGLLHFGGTDLIITDPEKIKLLPLEIRQTLLEATKTEYALLDFARHGGGTLISVTDPTKAGFRAEGIKKGLQILGFDTTSLKP